MAKALFTVDWEANCGRWLNGPETYHGGALGSTPYLESILDGLGISCTWFIESNARYPVRDLANRFPDLLGTISTRPRDEVGIHVHMGDYDANKDLWTYPEVTRDVEISNHFRHAVTGLADQKLRSVSFRSGAFYHPQSLPSLLRKFGFKQDSSRYYDGWVQSPASLKGVSLGDLPSALGTRVYRRLVLRSPLRPYECDNRDLTKPGKSGCLEVPCSIHLMYLVQNEHLLTRFWTRLKKTLPNVLVIYFHIFELLEPGHAGREPRVDGATYRKFQTILDELQSSFQVDFITMSQLGRSYVTSDTG